MIVVIAEVLVRPDAVDEALRISREHVERSRGEAGCISHDVLIDPGAPTRIVFVERWDDRDALDTHFAVPESNVFAAELRSLAAEPPHTQVLPIVPRD